MMDHETAVKISKQLERIATALETLVKFKTAKVTVEGDDIEVQFVSEQELVDRGFVTRGENDCR